MPTRSTRRWRLAPPLTLLALLLAATPATAQQTLYAVTGVGGDASTLFVLDPDDGSVRETVGATGVDGLHGLAVHPVTGDLYATSKLNNSEVGTQNLWTLDPRDGSASMVGAHGMDITDITFRSDGTLFGWVKGPDTIGTIDTTTGAVTLAANACGCGGTSVGLAFDDSDTLWVKNGTMLTPVDDATGMSAGAASAIVSPTNSLLAADKDGQLFSHFRNTDQLRRVNTDGSTNLVGVTGLDLTALAFAPPAAPLLSVGTLVAESDEEFVVQPLIDLGDAECVGGLTFLVTDLLGGAELLEAVVLDEGCLLEAEPIDDTTLVVGLVCAEGIEAGSRPFELRFRNGELPAETETDVTVLEELMIDCEGQPIAVVRTESGRVVTVDPCDDSAGDVHPPDVPDGQLDLSDFLAVRRQALGEAPTVAALRCGDIGASVLFCTPPDGPPHYCNVNAADNVVDIDDGTLLRQVLAGTAVISCDPCLTGTSGSGGDLRLPGDLAPDGGDGVLNIADVVKALRISVALDVPTEEELLRGDVNNAADVGGVLVVVPADPGSRVLNIADVVALLRGSVGLDTLAWPLREVVVDVPTPGGAIGYRAAIGNWPTWAVIDETFGVACATDPVGGLDQSGDACIFTCASDPTELDLTTGVLARLTYRGPESAPLVGDGALTLDLQLADVALDLTTPGDASLMGSDL
ncbi:MAG: hypothetical protein AAF533_14315 [Acidobacteriota bacterium]